MTLYLFIDAKKEMLHNALSGEAEDAKRYSRHLRSNHNTYTLVIVKGGEITVGDTEVAK